MRARSRILRTINHRYLADYLHVHTQGTGETLLIWPQSGELTSMQLAPLPPFSENFLDPSRPKQDVSQDLADLAAVAGTLCPTCLLPCPRKLSSSKRLGDECTTLTTISVLSGFNKFVELLQCNGIIAYQTLKTRSFCEGSKILDLITGVSYAAIACEESRNCVCPLPSPP